MGPQDAGRARRRDRAVQAGAHRRGLALAGHRDDEPPRRQQRRDRQRQGMARHLFERGKGGVFQLRYVLALLLGVKVIKIFFSAGIR